MKNLLHPALHSVHAVRSFNLETGEWGDALDPHFSWSPCECCGDSKGGDRFECDVLFRVNLDGRKSTGKADWTANCCPDCVVKWQ
jgi:hypothetical protein